MDIIFVNTNNRSVYGVLADNYSAIEPPVWSLLLAQSCRAKGYGVAILDAIAENLTHEETAQKIIDLKPRFCCFVTYGQNPNSGTTNMVGVYEVAKLVKEGSGITTISIGSHTQALPREVLADPNIDYVALNDGTSVLHGLLSGLQDAKIVAIGGLGWKHGGLNFNSVSPSEVANEQDLDKLLPGYAWDLLPYDRKPFDLYRAPLWHAWYQEKNRRPYAALYTSLGCKFKCNFCMINIVNRTSTNEKAVSSDFNNMRFWSPELMLKEFDKLIEYGITTIRLSDEMFFLNKKYYEPLLLGLKERGYGEHLQMWTYSRIDTVNDRFLDLFREGGVKLLGVGIEAANQEIRQELYKGKFQNLNIRDVIKQIHNHGIYVGANYIFGHPEETIETMQETLDLALELNTENANFYHAMALPGSPLYYEALENKWELPKNFDGWSFYSYNAQPLPTKYLSPAQVLKFRDEAWHTYWSNPNFHKLVLQRFGQEAVDTIKKQLTVKIKRKILGD